MLLYYKLEISFLTGLTFDKEKISEFLRIFKDGWRR